MPIIDPYFGTFEQFTENNYAEAVASFRPSGENIFNKRSGEASVVGYVPAVCLPAAMRYFLGYEQVERVDGDSPGTPVPDGYVALTSTNYLRRKNPMRHPRFEKLWCSGVGEIEFKPDASERAALKKMSFSVRTATPPAIGYRTGYDLAKLTLRFSPTMVKFREDMDADFGAISFLREEFRRNTSIDVVPRTETFEAKLVYRFAEGSGALPDTSNPIGEVVVAEQAQILLKPDVVVNWKDVPEQWIMNPGTQNPGNILFSIGTVNKGVFLGYTEGTILLAGVRFTRNPWTLRPERVPALVGADRESEYLFDIEFMFSYFNPRKGYTGFPLAQITTNRGHNNFPWRGNGVVATQDFNAGRWFYAIVEGSGDINTGLPLYRYTDMAVMFDSPLNYVQVYN